MFVVILERDLDMALRDCRRSPGMVSRFRTWRFEVLGCFQDEEYAVSGFVLVYGAAGRRAAGQGGG
jgi:hypothetical protein